MSILIEAAYALLGIAIGFGPLIYLKLTGGF